MAGSGSKTAVAAAIGGNFMVMLGKIGAFVFTGSGAMLSEAIHTLADLLNQILLLVGIVRSDRNPDDAADYGYRAERYVWALISAVGIFFLGCGVTVYHGISSLFHPHELDHIWWAVGVLVFSLLLEGWVLLIAVRSVLNDAKGKPFFNYLRKEADPATAAVVLEDFAACLGILIALGAIVLALVTGNPIWDAIGSIVIGVLLGLIAIWLIGRNSKLLIGVSVPAPIREQVLNIIKQNPAVEEVVDFKTRILDTETFRIKADVRFDGEALAHKLEPELKSAFDKIKDFQDFRNFAQQYADDVVELLADEIDAIEKRIQENIPQAKHMDLEAD
ncbi:MAG: cation diffusion facilitator family transporter [Planctomycetota bacterium]|nr:cation diffusion facilitator family transporter [Planctomycetota bacterium]